MVGFLELSTRYELWNSDTYKVSMFRDVKFFENYFPSPSQPFSPLTTPNMPNPEERKLPKVMNLHPTYHLHSDQASL